MNENFTSCMSFGLNQQHQISSFFMAKLAASVFIIWHFI